MEAILHAVTVTIPQVIAMASVIVKLTPTEVDNRILDWVTRILRAIALNK